MIRLVSIALLVTLPIAFSSEAATPQAAADCPKIDGMVQGPYVPTQDVAAKIYVTVGQAMFPKLFAELRIKYPIVSAVDEGDKWRVGQSGPYSKPLARVDNQGREVIVVSAGGGMLGMSIDKCTGAISEMSFAR